QVVEELDGSGRIKAQNAFGNGLLFRKDKATGKSGYYLFNSHGDVTKLVDARSGQVLNQYEYDIWGNPKQDGILKEEISNPFRYAGEILDTETGMYYLRARYYDPSVGRFISEDTYKGQVDNP
ncbi:RHS repeat-associated core domain-containing protein, partial [Microbacteriaceae bacterium K1510]|nr:RHS repeat-associated core domain-containing protein [Microbacteriaceae bacterium K1510]